MYSNNKSAIQPTRLVSCVVGKVARKKAVASHKPVPPSRTFSIAIRPIAATSAIVVMALYHVMISNVIFKLFMLLRRMVLTHSLNSCSWPHTNWNWFVVLGCRRHWLFGILLGYD